jgi:hypothetical protein
MTVEMFTPLICSLGVNARNPNGPFSSMSTPKPYRVTIMTQSSSKNAPVTIDVTRYSLRALLMRFASDALGFSSLRARGAPAGEALPGEVRAGGGCDDIGLVYFRALGSGRSFGFRSILRREFDFALPGIPHKAVPEEHGEYREDGPLDRVEDVEPVERDLIVG